jgi:hypothetical protein
MTGGSRASTLNRSLLTNSTSTLTTPVPPVGVFIVAGCGADVLINIALTILGYARITLIPKPSYSILTMPQLLPRSHPCLLRRIHLLQAPRRDPRWYVRWQPCFRYLQPEGAAWWYDCSAACAACCCLGERRGNGGGWFATRVGV